MDEGRESSWSDLALRAEMRPYIEKNSISIPLRLKSCHRRHLRRIVFGRQCSFSLDGKNSLGSQAKGSCRGSLVLSQWPWGESKNAGPQLHAIKVEGATCRKPGSVCLGQGQWVCLPFPQKMLRFAARPVLAIFDLIVASPDVALSGRERCILTTFQLEFA